MTLLQNFYFENFNWGFYEPRKDPFKVFLFCYIKTFSLLGMNLKVILIDLSWLFYIQNFDTFESDELDSYSNSGLQLYLDEPKLDKKYYLMFWIIERLTRFVIQSFQPCSWYIIHNDVYSCIWFAFSYGGQVLNQYHSTLKPLLVKTTLCMKDCLYRER